MSTASIPYNSELLWVPGCQKTQVFHWKEILEEWNESLFMPHTVQVIVENLKAASDPTSHHNPSINDFLRYFNWEQEGIKWFLYECIALRWMWGESRLDYVRDLIQEVDSLNSKFPVFPGSNGDLTINEFLTNHLNEAERIYLALQEPETHIVDEDDSDEKNSDEDDSEDEDSDEDSDEEEVNDTDMKKEDTPVDVEEYSIRTPPRVTRSATLTPPLTPQKPTRGFYKVPPYDSIKIILVRNDNPNEDDHICIYPSYPDSVLYTIAYKDKTASEPTFCMNQCLRQEDVHNYLSMTLRFLREDKDPFKSVQLMFPTIPSILITPNSLDSYMREMIYDAVEFTMNNWPART